MPTCTIWTAHPNNVGGEKKKSNKLLSIQHFGEPGSKTGSLMFICP